MKHLFVPYELALLSKEKGYNEECISWFFKSEKGFKLNELAAMETGIYTPYTNENWNVVKPNNIAAPLYQQLVDWFREKHGMNIYCYEVRLTSNSEGFNGCILSDSRLRKYNCETYYEALNAALTEAFKLIQTQLPEAQENADGTKF